MRELNRRARWWIQPPLGACSILTHPLLLTVQECNPSFDVELSIHQLQSLGNVNWKYWSGSNLVSRNVVPQGCIRPKLLNWSRAGYQGAHLSSVTRIRGSSGPAKHSRFTPLKGVPSARHLAWPLSSQAGQFLAVLHPRTAVGPPLRGRLFIRSFCIHYRVV